MQTRFNENVDLQGAIAESGTLSIVWAGNPTDPFDDARLPFVRTVLFDLSGAGNVKIHGVSIQPHGTSIRFFITDDAGGGASIELYHFDATNPGENILIPTVATLTFFVNMCFDLWYDATADGGSGAWRLKSFTQ